MEIVVRQHVEFISTFLHEYNGVDCLNVFVRKAGSLFTVLGSNLRILAHHEIAGIAGAPGSWEEIAHPLDFHIDESAGMQPHHNVHDQKRAVLGKTPGFIGDNLNNCHRLSHAAAEEPL